MCIQNKLWTTQAIEWTSAHHGCSQQTHRQHKHATDFQVLVRTVRGDKGKADKSELDHPCAQCGKPTDAIKMKQLSNMSGIQNKLTNQCHFHTPRMSLRRNKSWRGSASQQLLKIPRNTFIQGNKTSTIKVQTHWQTLGSTLSYENMKRPQEVKNTIKIALLWIARILMESFVWLVLFFRPTLSV